jgi:hypothetical protein
VISTLATGPEEPLNEKGRKSRRGESHPKFLIKRIIVHKLPYPNQTKLAK